MKLLVALFVLLAFLDQNLTKISRTNQYIKEAQTAYSRKDFTTAIYFYHYLNDSMQVRDRAVRLNLAHAYFLRRNNKKAFKNYQPLLTKTNARTASVVNLQLGVMAVPEDKLRALGYFKKSLILNPTNQEARYNYELLKKYLILHPEENKQLLPPTPPPQPKPNKEIQKEETQTSGTKENPDGQNEAEIPDLNNTDPENSSQPNSNQPTNDGNSEGEEINSELNQQFPQNQREANTGNLPGTNQGLQNQESKTGKQNQGKGGREESDAQDRNSQTTYERLREANISPEKAKMLLEAMREAEVQYLQQISRRNNQKTNSDKPTW